MQKFVLKVFGKPGCSKCKSLNGRLDKMLAEDKWQDFEKSYFSLDTEEGLIEFCNTECINPQRLPALVVAAVDGESGRVSLLENPRKGQPDATCKGSKLYTYLGLQTDYTDRGVLRPEMLESVFHEARQATA
jgi:hypothetical protein